FANRGREQLWPLYGACRCQQAAVADAADRQPIARRVALRDQLLGDGAEIVEDALAVSAASRFVPRFAVFAAAADVGDHVAAAERKPQRNVGTEFRRDRGT